MQAFAVETRFHSQPAHTYTRMSDIYVHISCVVIPLSSAADYVLDSSVIVPDNNIKIFILVSKAHAYLKISQSILACVLSFVCGVPLQRAGGVKHCRGSCSERIKKAYSISFS